VAIASTPDATLVVLVLTEFGIVVSGMSYTPPQEVLERYGEVMVNDGLGNGAGIKPGDVVGIVCREDAKPLLLEVAKAVWRAHGHVIVDYRPANDANWHLDRALSTSPRGSSSTTTPTPCAAPASPRSITT
jgi:hypothetical protein